MNAVRRCVQIRPYESDDAAATLSIFLAAITITAAADYSPEQIEAWARPDQRDVDGWHRAMGNRNSFVATVNSEVAGFSDVDAHGHIDMMFVAPQHQRQGIARMLLGEAEYQAREFRVESLTADVSITARPVFERQGFFVQQQQQLVRHGVQLTNYRMRKVLLGGKSNEDKPNEQ